MSNRRPGAFADMKPLDTAPLASMPWSPYAAMDQGPVSARPDLNGELPPPPPLPKDKMAPLPEILHKRGDSMDSRSSYGTVSFRNGDSGSKRSTMLSSRRPSFGSVTQDPQALLDDRYSMRPSPLETLSEIPTPQEGLGVSGNSEEDARYSSFDFGIPAERNNREAVIHPGDQLDVSHAHSASGSSELFRQRTPSSAHSPGLSVDKPRSLNGRRSPSSASVTSNGHPSRKPSGSAHYLHPGSIDETNRRKNSDASEGGNTVSNFARALGLENGEHRSTESSTASSDFSPSDSRSGTSLSSLPSEASLSRRKASEASRLGPVVEEHNPQESPSNHEGQSASPVTLDPPKIPSIFPSPDSPTEPAISQGSLTLISDCEPSPRSDTLDSPGDRSPVSPAKERPAAILAPSPRPVARPKGRCRGCGEAILGKSVSSADGRLTGRYHKECFACCYCRIQFQTVDFYVLKDRPYCAQHYHELNGSLCSTCDAGIEGHYLETDERQGRGPADRRKFHPECLTCRTCNVILKGEYFEWNGLVYCERDARRAAASVSPHRFRRPTLPSSPMAPRPYGPPGAPGPMGRPPFPPSPGRRPPPMGMGPDGYGPPGPYGPYGPPLPPPGRRFPERRTTRLMMI